MEHKKYEYLTTRLPSIYDTTLNDWLNEMGEDGWELCCWHNWYYIFKRAIINQPS